MVTSCKSIERLFVQIFTTPGNVSGNVPETVNDEFPVKPLSDSEEDNTAEVAEPQVEEPEHAEAPLNPDTSQPCYPQRDRHPPDGYA